MKIALINENSQAAKNALIEATLRKVVEPMGHEVVNYGMYAADDAAQLTYVQNGILAAVLLNSGAADYVITGCGTGEGAMLALNSFPGVICGHVEDPVDAYTFAHVNDGNAVALPFAKGFGWGGELNLEYIFEKLFGFGHGQGYPKERVEPEQRNKKILDGVRAVAFGEVQLAGTRRPTELSNRCATELLEYFAGKRTAFDVPLDPEGTEFQKSVWEALSRVPFATSVTSGDIARDLGKPKSYRAVGAAVRENPLAVIVPDHRVVRANGRPIAADARGRIREGLLHMEKERSQATT